MTKLTTISIIMFMNRIERVVDRRLVPLFFLMFRPQAPRDECVVIASYVETVLPLPLFCLILQRGKRRICSVRLGTEFSRARFGESPA